MNSALKSYIDALVQDTNQIEASRTQILDSLTVFIQQQMDEGRQAKLTFICTHNSRRSHFGQIWAQAAAEYFGFGDSVKTYSGGTEATAFNPRAVKATEKAGFLVKNPGGDNPRYEVSIGKEKPTMICFSKTYDDQFNPSSDFAAVMTCSDADENCPVILGAKSRIPLTYEDPKMADDTPFESERYDERCKQIATEMLYVMSNVKV